MTVEEGVERPSEFTTPRSLSPPPLLLPLALKPNISPASRPAPHTLSAPAAASEAVEKTAVVSDDDDNMAEKPGVCVCHGCGR